MEPVLVGLKSGQPTLLRNSWTKTTRLINNPVHMKCLLIVGFFVFSFSLTVAQEYKSGKHDYATSYYAYHEIKFDKDSTGAPLRKLDPLFLIKYAETTEEITKEEFEELTRRTSKSVEYLTVLKDSKSLEPYGTRGRSGVVLMKLNGKPTFS